MYERDRKDAEYEKKCLHLLLSKLHPSLRNPTLAKDYLEKNFYNVDVALEKYTKDNGFTRLNFI